MDASAPDFREARAAEAGTIAEFQVAMAKETEDLALDPETCREGVRAVFDDPAKGRYYVAAVEGRVAGTLLITYEWSDWRNGTVWWIQSVYVAPEHRGRKLYSGLYGFVRTLAASDPSVRGIRLYVDKQNRTAQKAYAALGMSDEHYHLFEWMKPL